MEGGGNHDVATQAVFMKRRPLIVVNEGVM